jgi:hypothetical protein
MRLEPPVAGGAGGAGAGGAGAGGAGGAGAGGAGAGALDPNKLLKLLNIPPVFFWVVFFAFAGFEKLNEFFKLLNNPFFGGSGTTGGVGGTKGADILTYSKILLHKIRKSAARSSKRVSPIVKCLWPAAIARRLSPFNASIHFTDSYG